MDHNAAETNKNICCAKSKGMVDHSTVAGWLKKFRSGCENLEAQTRWARPKSVGFEAVLQVLEANLASSTRSSTSQFSVGCYLHDHGKSGE